MSGAKKIGLVAAVVGGLAVAASLGKQMQEPPAVAGLELLGEWEPRVAGGGDRVSVRGPVTEDQVKALVAGRETAEVFVYEANRAPGRDRPDARFLWTRGGLTRVY